MFPNSTITLGNVFQSTRGQKNLALVKSIVIVVLDQTTEFTRNRYLGFQATAAKLKSTSAPLNIAGCWVFTQNQIVTNMNSSFAGLELPDYASRPFFVIYTSKLLVGGHLQKDWGYYGNAMDLTQQNNPDFQLRTPEILKIVQLSPPMLADSASPQIPLMVGAATQFAVECLYPHRGCCLIL